MTRDDLVDLAVALPVAIVAWLIGLTVAERRREQLAALRHRRHRPGWRAMRQTMGAEDGSGPPPCWTWED